MKLLCCAEWNTQTSSCWSRRWTRPLSCVSLWSWLRSVGGKHRPTSGFAYVWICNISLQIPPREGICLMPSCPQPSTQRKMPAPWSTTWLQRCCICTASTSSTETLNLRTCWYYAISKKIQQIYLFFSSYNWALSYRCLRIQVASSRWNSETLAWPQ